MTHVAGEPQPGARPIAAGGGPMAAGVTAMEHETYGVEPARREGAIAAATHKMGRGHKCVHISN